MANTFNLFGHDAEFTDMDMILLQNSYMSRPTPSIPRTWWPTSFDAATGSDVHAWSLDSVISEGVVWSFTTAHTFVYLRQDNKPFANDIVAAIQLYDPHTDSHTLLTVTEDGDVVSSEWFEPTAANDFITSTAMDEWLNEQLFNGRFKFDGFGDAYYPEED